MLSRTTDCSNAVGRPSYEHCEHLPPMPTPVDSVAVVEAIPVPQLACNALPQANFGMPAQQQPCGFASPVPFEPLHPPSAAAAAWHVAVPAVLAARHPNGYDTADTFDIGAFVVLLLGTVVYSATLLSSGSVSQNH